MQPISRRRLLAATAAALAAPAVCRAAASPPIRLGVLCDMNGPYANLSGASVVAATRLAAEDFGHEHPDIEVEVTYADFQLKPDNGLAIARNWFANDGVDALVDIPMSALAVGLSTLLREKNKVGLFTGTATEDLTGRFCTPNQVHWTYDTYGMANTVARTLLARGLDTWFFIAADYAMGAAAVRDATTVITRGGGKVIGVARHPFPGTGDFSSLLLQAKASGAKVICFANAGDDLINCLKQANEFGINHGGQVLAALLCDVPQVRAAGLDAAEGVFYSDAFYWNMSPASRAFTARLLPLTGNIHPAQNVAGAYSATLHYLRAVAAVGPQAAATDGAAVVAQMKKVPFEDPLLGRGVVRADGRCMNRLYLFQVRPPGQTADDWDVASQVAVLPPEEVYRPLAESACRMPA